MRRAEIWTQAGCDFCLLRRECLGLPTHQPFLAFTSIPLNAADQQ